MGKKPRYVAIFSYVEEPRMVGSPERTKQLYGKKANPEQLSDVNYDLKKMLS